MLSVPQNLASLEGVKSALAAGKTRGELYEPLEQK